MNPRHYLVVTGAYWAFTLTDGALRMLVLLHFFQLGFAPTTLALLFVLYELCGVATNLLGGWVAARTGLRATLLGGLALQVAALALLAGLEPAWPVAASVAWATAAQALSGIAKDLTKLSAKSAIRVLVPPDAAGALFRWVALLTGSKNALKGAGFFLGGALLAGAGFRGSLLLMAAGLALVWVGAWLALPRDLGRGQAKPGWRELFAKSRAINVLGAARFFLFGARDIWFVVGVPVFLRGTLGWSFPEVGAFLAAWVIGYGLVQGSTPGLFRGRAPGGASATAGAGLLALVAAALPAGLAAGLAPAVVVIGGLAAFGVVFALNAAIHSYLILDYTDGDKVALDVGFYYMANAGGRLVGCLLSGLLYESAGLAGTLWGAAAFAAAAAAISCALPRRARDPQRLAAATVRAGDGD